MVNGIFDVRGFLDHYMSSLPVIPSCASEADWYRYWQSQALNQLEPALMALQGGVHAPNLSCVFTSGYQAAIRNVFPETPDTGWAAFAASEDTRNRQENPPLLAQTAADCVTLNGTKSWVAQSKNVNYLIVTAKNERNELVTAVVDVNQPGVELSHRESASFLSEMSQGFARFSGVKVASSDCIQDDRLKTFMKRESKFILLALSGWFYSQCLKNRLTLSSEFKSLALDYFTVCQDDAVKVTRLAALDTRLQALFTRFEDEHDLSNVSNWHGDRALVSTYSKGIQTRAARYALPA